MVQEGNEEALPPEEVQRLLRRIKELEERNRELERRTSVLEEALRAQLLTTAGTASGVWLLDAEGRIIRSNGVFETLLGKPTEQVLGKHCWEVVHGTKAPPRECAFLRMKRTAAAQVLEFDDPASGRRFEHHLTPTRSEDGSVSGGLLVATEVTARTKERRRYERFRQAYRTLREINQLLATARDEHTFLTEVCRHLVEEGGYRLAWVGFPAEGRAEGLRPVAHWGIEAAELRPLAEAFSTAHPGAEPALSALRTGSPVAVRDLLGDPLYSHLHAEAERLGFASVICLPVSSEGVVIGVLTVCSPEREAFDSEETLLLGTVASDVGFCLDALRGKDRERMAAEDVERAQARVRSAARGTMQALSRVVETRDPYTHGHQERVARLAVAIAQEMGLAEERVHALHLAAMVHDIGKIAVPAEILSKPGRLTAPEFEMVKAHAVVGSEILQNIVSPWPLAEIVQQHHERIDGSGYPHGLRGDDILLEARILGVADVVEAMSSHRPYRPARGIEAALKEISDNRGVLYDPEVADSCLALFRERGFSLNPN